MELDTNFKNKIDALLEGYKLSELKEATFSIIDQYKQENKEHPVIDNELKAKIYAATRMPATYKVAVDVLYQVFTIYHPYVALSLDIGAGLGAATKALDDYYITNDLVLYEKEDAMINLAKKLYGDEDVGKRLQFRKFDATKDEIEERDYGLVMSSYVLNELKPEERKLVM